MIVALLSLNAIASLVLLTLGVFQVLSMTTNLIIYLGVVCLLSGMAALYHGNKRGGEK